MSIILNIAALVVCLIWLIKSDKSSKVLLAIVCSFIGVMLLSFIISLIFEHDYLDGVGHMLVMGGSAILFYAASLFLIWRGKAGFNLAERIGKSAILSIVIVLPILVYALVSNLNFKIGG